jgi:hypothetical protein
VGQAASASHIGGGPRGGSGGTERGGGQITGCRRIRSGWRLDGSRRQREPAGRAASASHGDNGGAPRRGVVAVEPRGLAARVMVRVEGAGWHGYMASG